MGPSYESRPLADADQPDDAGAGHVTNLHTPYQHGRGWTWLSIKNPASSAAKRIEDGTL